MDQNNDSILQNVNHILDISKMIEQTQGIDDACKTLGNYRRAAFLRFPEEPEQLLVIAKILERQCALFLKLQKPELCLQAVEAFFHLLQTHPPQPTLAPLLRDPLSRICLHAASACATQNDFANMRMQIRSALDSSPYLEFCILKSIPLWLKAQKYNQDIENKPNKHWIQDRFAEMLAQLDFAHKNATTFRKLLDLYQRALYADPDKIPVLKAELSRFSPESIEDKTLYDIIFSNLENNP